MELYSTVMLAWASKLVKNDGKPYRPWNQDFDLW